MKAQFTLSQWWPYWMFPCCVPVSFSLEKWDPEENRAKKLREGTSSTVMGTPVIHVLKISPPRVTVCPEVETIQPIEALVWADSGPVVHGGGPPPCPHGVLSGPCSSIFAKLQIPRKFSPMGDRIWGNFRFWEPGDSALADLFHILPFRAHCGMLGSSGGVTPCFFVPESKSPTWRNFFILMSKLQSLLWNSVSRKKTRHSYHSENGPLP